MPKFKGKSGESISKAYCRLCGKPMMFNPPQRWPNEFCGTCYRKIYQQEGFRPRNHKRYCFSCGKLLGKNSAPHRKYCFGCLDYKPEFKYIVLGECKCNDFKHKHHPDYAFPDEVFMLCASCHAFEHKIISYCVELEEKKQRIARLETILGI